MVIDSRDISRDELEQVDLTDPRTHLRGDSSAMWRSFRSKLPFFKHRGVTGKASFWVASKYETVKEVYANNRDFTSEQGNVLTTLLSGRDSGGRQMLALTDGPRHLALRKVLQAHLGPRVLRFLEKEIKERTDRLLWEMIDKKEGDFASEFAEHIPIATVCDLLGVPPVDRKYLLTLNKKALSSETEHQTESESWEARCRILAYFEDLCISGDSHVEKGLIGALSRCRIEGKPLTSFEVASNCYSLALGGDETSRLAMIGAVKSLSEFRDQWLRLRNGEVDVDDAAEEVLRWTSPAMSFGRVALQDVRMAGQLVRKGDIVTVWNNSANADEREFDSPNAFQLHRRPNKHLALGYGAHFCVGAFLARSELRTLLEALRSSVSQIELAGEPKRVHSNVLTGFSNLPVQFLRA